MAKTVDKKAKKNPLTYSRVPVIIGGRKKEEALMVKCHQKDLANVKEKPVALKCKTDDYKCTPKDTNDVCHLLIKIDELKKYVRELESSEKRTKMTKSVSSQTSDVIDNLYDAQTTIKNCEQELMKLTRFLQDENSWWMIFKERKVTCCGQTMPHLHGYLDGAAVTLKLSEEGPEKVLPDFTTDLQLQNTATDETSEPKGPKVSEEAMSDGDKIKPVGSKKIRDSLELAIERRNKTKLLKKSSLEGKAGDGKETKLMENFLIKKEVKQELLKEGAANKTEQKERNFVEHRKLEESVKQENALAKDLTGDKKHLHENKKKRDKANRISRLIFGNEAKPLQTFITENAGINKSGSIKNSTINPKSV